MRVSLLLWQAKVDKTLISVYFNILKCFQVQSVLTNKKLNLRMIVCVAIREQISAYTVFIYFHVF